MGEEERGSVSEGDHWAIRLFDLIEKPIMEEVEDDVRTHCVVWL